MKYLLSCCLLLLTLGACRNVRIKEYPEWERFFRQYGIAKGSFILRDHTHESLHLYNKDGCLKRYAPGATFHSFAALVALETAVAQDETFVLSRDSAASGAGRVNMRAAFRNGDVAYFQELVRRTGAQNLQHYLDTVKYGNRQVGNAVDSCWLNNTLQVSADEQVGYLKRLYFEELPFTLRTQTIVRSLMLQEDSAGNKVFYQTGRAPADAQHDVVWVSGFMEHQEEVKEHKNSMNKSDVRNYPYVFALNFEVPKNDASRDWDSIRIRLLHDLLNAYGTFRTP